MLSNSSTSNYAVNAAYNLPIASTGMPLDLSGLVDHLPRFIRTSAFGQGLRQPRLKLAPSNIRWSSGLTHDEAIYRSYLVPVSRPDDSLLTASQALSQLWRNSGGLTLQPFEAVMMSADG